MQNLRSESAAPRDVDAATVADAVWLWRAMGHADAGADTPPVATEPNQHDTLTSYAVGAQPDATAETDAQLYAGDEFEVDDGPGELVREGVGPLFPPKLSSGAAEEQHPVARVGALRTLTDRNGFKNGLRTFRSRPRGHAVLLDEVATVEDFVIHGLRRLILKPQQQSRRWLRLSLLVEATPSNALWHQSVDELEAMARQQGSFRQVRRWSLGDHATGMLRQVGHHGRLGRGGTHLASAVWWKNEIIIIVSDFTSAPWWNGGFAPAVRRLANQQPLLLLHTLPQRLWHRSWTGMPDALAFAPAPACATAAMQVFEAGIGVPVPAAGRQALPIIAMQGAQFRHWSRALMESSALKMPALFPDARCTDEDEAHNASGTSDPDAIVIAYKMASSALGRRLAGYMAIAAPLTFPMMRWVQQALLQQSDASHLAEFVLGGLLRRVGGDASTAADDVVYDFIDGVRETLQVGTPISHAIDVLRKVGEYLEANQDDTLDARTGVATWPNQELDTLSPSLRAFALVSRNFLARIGLPVPVAPQTVMVAPQIVRSTPPMESAPKARKPPPRNDAMHAYRARNLKHTVLDLQWSPSTPGLLAVLHEGDVEVWDTQEPQGVLIAREATGERQPRTITLFWVAGEDWTANRARLGSIRSIIGRVADGLRSGGGLRLSVVHIKTRQDLDKAAATALTTALLIIFESASMGTGPDLHHGDLDFLMSKRSTLVASVRLDERAEHIRNTSIRADLTEFMYAELTDNTWRRYTSTIGQFTLELRAAVAESRTDGPSAICWLGDGSLVLAERHGRDCTISRIMLSNVERGTPVHLKNLLAKQSDSHVQQLCFLRTHQNESGTSLAFEPNTPPLAWTDGTGALYFEGSLRASGSGAGRLLAPSDALSRVAVSNHAFGINLVDSKTARVPKRVTQLLPLNRRDATTNPLAFFTGRRPIAIATVSGLVQAVTSNGYLHRGHISDFNKNGISNPAPCLDKHPVDLGLNVKAAAFCAQRDLLCVVKPGGSLELWNTSSANRVDRLRLAEARVQFSRPVIAMSPDGQLLASANGRSLHVFRIDESRGGFADIPKNGPQPAHLLWVDDRPENNLFERDRFREINIVFTLVKSTAQAMQLLRRYRFAGVISDMGRKKGSQEGYVLLDAMRADNDDTPVFFYAGSNARHHRETALARGAQGSTNNFHELAEMVTRSLTSNVARA